MSAPRPKTLDFEQLESSLDNGEIVPLRTACWEELRERYDVRDEIATGMAGSILLIRRANPARGAQAGWLLVEEPEPRIRVARPLASEHEARALIADRLAAYERMWDG